MTLKANNTESKFFNGQKVRVVAGTKDPDYGFPIEGWSGSIEDKMVDEEGNGGWLYIIRWDDSTLKSMSRSLHKMCNRDNFDVNRMSLAEHELSSE